MQTFSDNKIDLENARRYQFLGWFPLSLFFASPLLALLIYLFPAHHFLLGGKDLLIGIYFFWIFWNWKSIGRKFLWMLAFFPLIGLATVSFFTSDAILASRAASMRQLLYPILFLLAGSAAGLNKEAIEKLRLLQWKHAKLVLAAGFLMYFLQSSELAWIKPYFEAKGIGMSYPGVPAQWLEPIWGGIKRFASPLFDPVNFGHWITFVLFFAVPSLKKTEDKLVFSAAVLALILSFCKGAWLQSLIVISGLILPISTWMRASLIACIPILIYVAAGFHGGIANHQTGLENAIQTMTFSGCGLGNAGNVAIIFDQKNSPEIFDTYAGAVIGQLGISGFLAWAGAWTIIILLLFLSNRKLAWLLMAQIITAFYSENAFNLLSTFSICSFIGMNLNLTRDEKKKLAIIDPVGKKAGMDFYSGSLAAATEKSGIRCLLFSNVSESFPVRRVFNSERSGMFGKFLDYFGGHFRSFNICIQEDVSDVLFHSFKTGPKEFLMILISKILGFRNHILIHDVESFDGKENRILKFLTLKILADRIFCQNSSSRSLLSTQYKINENEIKLIPHGHFLALAGPGIDSSMARRKLGLPENEFIFLFFGQIKPVKGLDVLIKALASVPGAHLVIAGKERGSDFSQYLDEIKQTNLQDRVHFFIRYIENEERDLFFRAANCLVIPYRKIFQSGVLIMGMSYLLPCIASDLPANRELIEDGTSGFLFENENSASLAAAMNKVKELTSPKEISNRAKEILTSRCSWETGGKILAEAVTSAQF